MALPVNIGMPEGLDIGPSYIIRVTAIDPTSGALVSGVVVNTVILTAALIEGSADQMQTGDWFLVPGPNA